MKTKMLIIAIILTFQNAIAQTPGKFNYQGLALNGQGEALVNQDIKLRFTIHDSTSTGNVLYKETRKTKTDSTGLFEIIIGDVGATNIVGNLNNINWAVYDKFLQTEIQIVGNGGFVKMGTSQLLSVPYSEMARKADSAKYASYTSNLKTTVSDASSLVADIIPGGSTAIIAFVSNNFNDTNYNSVTHEYTIPSSGNYLIAFNLNLSQLSNGGKANGLMAIRINGSNTLYTQQFKYPSNTDATGNYYPVTGTYIRYFSTGQKITIAVSNYGNSDDPLNTFYIFGKTLNIFKIGNK